MSDGERPYKKTTIYDFLIKLINDLNIFELPKYQKFNIIISILLIGAVLLLSLPPALILLNNIITTIVNGVVIVFGYPEYIQPSNNSASINVKLPLVFVLIETIACLILCCFYRKMNSNSNKDD